MGRIWTDVSLRDGVATIPIRGSLPPAFRVHVDGYDGGPLGATPLGLATPSPSGPLVEQFLEALGPFVAACTGLPVSAVHSSVALEAPVPGDVLVQAARGETPGRGRVVVAHTRVPSGALLRSIRVAGDGRGEAGPVDVETTRVVSPDATTAPRSPPGSPRSTTTSAASSWSHHGPHGPSSWPRRRRPTPPPR